MWCGCKLYVLGVGCRVSTGFVAWMICSVLKVGSGVAQSDKLRFAELEVLGSILGVALKLSLRA